MAKVLICYVRGDGWHASRLHDRLAVELGPGTVFLEDQVSIPPGVNWKQAIMDFLRSCEAIIAVIGPAWMAVDGEGRRNVDAPNAPVRVVLDEALRLENMMVIPVLVGDAEMPRRGGLPESLKTLAERQALVIPQDGPASGAGIWLQTLLDAIEHLGSRAPIGRRDREGTELCVGDYVQVTDSARYGTVRGYVLGAGPDRGDGKQRIRMRLEDGRDDAYTPSTDRVTRVSRDDPATVPAVEDGFEAPPAAPRRPRPDVEPPFDACELRGDYLFVSYAHLDKAIVYPELQRIAAINPAIWYDEGIDPGNEWTENIARALRGCEWFIVMISPRAVVSENVCNEISFAIKRQKPFLAIHLEETTLPDALELQFGSRQAIYAWRMDYESFDRKLRKVLPAPEFPGVTPQQRFERAYASYAPEDRTEVLKRHPMLRAMGIECLLLDPGQDWKKERQRQIDDADVFLLFWSGAAKRSAAVRHEVAYALMRQNGDPNAKPKIVPMVIEGPPIEPPWEELSHLHFHDSLMHLR